MDDFAELRLGIVHFDAANEDFDQVVRGLLFIIGQLVLLVDVYELPRKQQLRHGDLECLTCLRIYV